MIQYIKADLLKQKHRFNKKLIWLAPIIPIAISLVLMQGRFFVDGCFNWWSTMILPGALSMIITFTTSYERKANRHGLFAVCVDKRKLWLAELLLNTIFLFYMNVIFVLFLLISCAFLGVNVNISSSILAGLILFLTMVWQIPFIMWLSEKTGTVVTMILSLLCNMGFGLFFSPTRLWQVPFAIPTRLLCPIMRIAPNGLPLEEGNPLCDGSVIFSGLVITITLYAVITLLTTVWFQHREVK